MAKKRILKLLLWIMSAPQVAISKWMERFPGLYGSDLERCISYVDKYQSSMPPVLIGALIEAEDHRSAYHPGVDPIGMIRAVWTRVATGRVQGASTIEQQFVRVVTKRYERNVFRKVREQLLAVSLVRRREKEAIASAYLAIAFYGSSYSGIDGLKARFGASLEHISEQQALRFIAQLKYPRPLWPSAHWHNKINGRTEMLWKRRGRAANKPFQGALRINAMNKLIVFFLL